MVVASLAFGDNLDPREIPEESLDTEPAQARSDPAEILRTANGRLSQGPVANPSSSTEAERILNFLTRLQTLEREYSALQGRVEELEYFYQEERELNRKRFLDLDRRFREATGGQLTQTDALTSEEEVNTEAGIYRRAIAFIDAQNYSEAKNLLSGLVNDFPNGERVPDAYYWLGDLNLNIEPKDLEQARQYFVQMITLYNDHARIPHAITKLGMIYHQLGNVERALEYFDRVMSEFPDHDAARLAETYARDLR